MAMTLPAGIVVERSASTLDTLLRDGEIDAVISPTAPRCFGDDSVPVARMWSDPRSQELDYWRRRHVFPIMHVLVVRRTLADAHPGLLDAVHTAFEEARRLAAADLVNRDFPKLALPWLSNFAQETRAVLGGDPWTYGLEANRATLETMLRYAEADGLTSQRLTPDDLFR